MGLPGEITCDTTMGALAIDGVTMHCPAWCILDVLQFWVPNGVRGENDVLPEVEGDYPLPLRRAGSRYTVPISISGIKTRLGALHANRWQGLADNLAYLQANVFDPPALPDTTRPAVLTMPNGSTRSADVQVFPLEPINPGTEAALIEATFELVIPAAGGFV